MLPLHPALQLRLELPPRWFNGLCSPIARVVQDVHGERHPQGTRARLAVQAGLEVDVGSEVMVDNLLAAAIAVPIAEVVQASDAGSTIAGIRQDPSGEYMKEGDIVRLGH